MTIEPRTRKYVKMLWNIENGKTNRITNKSKLCEQYNLNKLWNNNTTWMNTCTILKLSYINPMDRFQTFATNGLNKGFSIRMCH